VKTLVPPSRGLPEEKLAGMGYIECEPGKKQLHGPDAYDTTADRMMYMPCIGGLMSCQPAMTGDRILFMNKGKHHGCPESLLHYRYIDGSTDLAGVEGTLMAKGTMHFHPRLAASPDGKTVYLSRVSPAGVFASSASSYHCVYARDIDGREGARVFVGDPRAPGSDNAHLNTPLGIDTDPQGRVYVVDSMNQRVQVFSPEGKHLKTIKISRPELVCVHKKTGAIYIQHTDRERGKSVVRVTKLSSFDNPKREYHVDGLMGMMALDSWSERPRLWLSGMQIGSSRIIRKLGYLSLESYKGSGSVTIWEEQGKALVKVADFEAEAKKEAGNGWFQRWSGICSVAGPGNLQCDPTREKLYYWRNGIFDLRTGVYEGQFSHNGRYYMWDDISFDKRGYVHGHQNCLQGARPCVWRLDPDRASGVESRKAGGVKSVFYPECPYDYGVKRGAWTGAIATKCQPGAKGFQDGFGANMRGDMVVESNIYNVPKMQDMGDALAIGGQIARGHSEDSARGYAHQSRARELAEAAKTGEAIWFVRRKPGTPLAGATFWVFDSSGELRHPMPVVIGGLAAGVQIDEDGFIYFTMGSSRTVGDKVFLEGHGGIFGDPGAGKNRTPFTGTYVKADPKKLQVLLKKAVIPVDQPPERTPDVFHPYAKKHAWIENAEWLYAGSSPITSHGCSCPSSRFHLDWYKRSYVPEAYRHSIGILDTNGNLIMHLGRYGNFDSAPGGREGCTPGETDIGIICARYIGGTDNYLAFEDWGEKTVVLRLDYHAEERVPIGQ
jgi:hypothetical protein